MYDLQNEGWLHESVEKAGAAEIKIMSMITSKKGEFARKGEWDGSERGRNRHLTLALSPVEAERG
jgi:hypothetical protein